MSLTALVTACLLAQSFGEADRLDIRADWPVPDEPEAGVMLIHTLSPLTQPKISPLHKWEFRFITAGLARTLGRDDYTLRFQVFGQARTQDHNDVAQWSTRQLLRMWGYNMYRLNFDHAESFRRVVDVYLSFGGDPGGEQLFTQDPQLTGSNRRANVIYIYSVYEINRPIDLARELAHEYGHATLPSPSGYTQPENWANGELGERVYLKWLRDDIAAGRLREFDAVNTPLAQLDEYLKAKVDPMVAAFAAAPPNVATMRKKDAPGMMAWVGMCVYAQAILPPRAFGRMLALGNPEDPMSYERSFRETLAERPEWKLNVPPVLKEKAFWFPVGKGQLTGASIQTRQGNWARIRVPSGSFTIKFPAQG